VRLPTRRNMLLAAVAIAGVGWSMHQLAQHANAATSKSPTGTMAPSNTSTGPVTIGKAAPTTPTDIPAGTQTITPNPEIKSINDQLKTLRDQYHAQLDPLEAQIKSLRDQFDPKIKALEEQKKTLVEQGKPQAIQDLDRQEESDLAALADREKTDITGVRQKYSEERTQITQKYDAQRKELLAGKR